MDVDWTMLIVGIVIYHLYKVLGKEDVAQKKDREMGES